MSKKGGKPKTKAKAAAADEHVVTRQIVLANYGKLCKSIGVPVNTHVNDVLRGPAEEEQEIVNFILEGEIGALGPGSVRAIAMAFLISFFPTVPMRITSGPYLHLRYIRIWNEDVGNEGAAAIGMLLQSTAPSINIAYLELLDCEIGEAGCKAISEIVSTQKTPGLLTLNLDYNSDIGDHGVTALCDGLFSNTILKKLHLDYCGIGPRGAVKLAQLLSMPQSALDTLSLNGNALGDEGLYHLSLGLARSQHLTSINLADNGIRHDEEALTAFRDALLRSKVLAHVDFTYNPIDVLGAMLLLPALTPENTKIQSFQVDSSLPAELFAQLNRAPKGDGKKKGKKKGGKKKK
ncbi:hypothetical protein Poli38472_003001 [Pythium oligandrum]|uniref:Uncharacterized protein n=1 Tax=Pythium oligandrum TaxID=41045 RepID=A0A8K1FCD7_PYTOL|nr:hypothetical protein Poli38472_003001 [Pythium oligandrum]|eukprot:TMW57076.1 hypothetical protein Poli38472_003001 [Pythium oligandrum]